jgi:hypothetical protein
MVMAHRLSSGILLTYSNKNHLFSSSLVGTS